MKAILNGSAAQDWVQSRALHYGDGIFRTLLIWQGAPLDWDLQYGKLSADCAALGLEAPAQACLASDIEKLQFDEPCAVLKIMVWRKAGARGYAPTQTASDRLCLAYPAPRYPTSHWDIGIKTFQCDIQLSAQPALAGIKHLNRLEQVLASRAWPADMDEGLLSDREGHVICGTRSNLFWVSQDQLYSPALDTCGVAGIMRSKIYDAATSIKIPVCTSKSDWNVLLSSDEAFICNSLIGIWPLRSLGSQQWGGRGPVTTALQLALAHPRID